LATLPTALLIKGIGVGVLFGMGGFLFSMRHSLESFIYQLISELREKTNIAFKICRIRWNRFFNSNKNLQTGFIPHDEKDKIQEVEMRQLSIEG
jgi:hypothetical protein